MQGIRSDCVRLLSLVLTGCFAQQGAPGESEQALSDAFCPPEVPDDLAPDADQRLWTVLVGEGVQIYRCDQVSGAYTWSFVAPEADLLDPGGAVVGTHYSGPRWEAVDGSTVKAARRASVTVTADSIPWLLLDVVDHEGQGRFSGVSSIQRLETVGGTTPTTVCDVSNAGTIERIPYTADYVFYVTGQGNTDANPQCR